MLATSALHLNSALPFPQLYMKVLAILRMSALSTNDASPTQLDNAGHRSRIDVERVTVFADTAALLVRDCEEY